MLTYMNRLSAIQTAYYRTENQKQLRIAMESLERSVFKRSVELKLAYQHHGGEIMSDKIQTLSTVKIKNSEDLYKIVDSLNRTLKEDDLMFGLALDEDDDEKAIFTIYRT